MSDDLDTQNAWNHIYEGAIARAQRAEARITELETWKREVADGIGYAEEWHGAWNIAPSAHIVERFKEAESELGEAEEKLAAAQATIAAALEELRSGSVPLGASLMRHWDLKIINTRRILSEGLS